MVLDECPAPAGRRETLRQRSVDLTARWARAVPRALSRAARRPPVGRRPSAARPSSASCRGASSRSCARESAAADVDDRLRGLRHRRPERRRAERRRCTSVIEQTAPLLPAGPAALSDGRRHARSTWSRRWRAASTCSTASCRPATRGTASCSPARAAINIKNARYAEDDGPLDPACGCYTCRHVLARLSAALFLAGEMTAGTLNTLHNLYFYLDTMRTD